MKNLKFVLLLPVLFLVFLACERDKNDTPPPSGENIYSFTDEIMHSYYLWYTDVPTIDHMGYPSPSALLEDLKYSLDKWSFVDKTETVHALFEEGEYFGFGFYIRFDENEDLRVPLIYATSTAYIQGIRKGDRIESINGVPVRSFTEYESFFDDEAASMTFEIYNKTGELKTYTLSKENVVQNSVFFTDVYEISGKKTGYIVYDSFLGYSATELEESFTFFSQQNIDELVVDLRYNGGGYISLAEEMAEMIVPASSVGKDFYSIVHNDLIASANDTTVNFKAHNLNLDLERVFFITSGNTASASELVINCLSPYMDVVIIGSKTHGKPVGMHGFEFQDWILFPVVNLIENAEGFGEYFGGLDVDKETSEGLDKDWGDLTDPALSEALFYISNGSFKSTLYPSSKSVKQQVSFGSETRRNVLLLDR